MRRACVVLPVLLVLAPAVVPAIVALVFNASYASATLACQTMAVAGVLLLANRLAATVLQALGEFNELTRQAVTRLVLSLSLSALAIVGLHTDAALAVGLALMTTEIALGLRLIVVLRKSAVRTALAATPVQP
jgi:O-antigen/teichoic acid export membrane protein